MEGLPIDNSQIAAVNVPGRTQGGDRCRHLRPVDDDVDIEDGLGRQPWHRG